jgi:flagella synthesis protein FlgN
MNDDLVPMTALLREQLRCAEQLLDALTLEGRALESGNHDALGDATTAKAKLVDSLEQLESKRRALADHDAPSNTAEWPKLRDLIARCKEQNQRNGVLLNARAENVRIALKALRGSEPELYGATGRAPARADARRLGTA